jgi:hypothetical protein
MSRSTFWQHFSSTRRREAPFQCPRCGARSDNPYEILVNHIYGPDNCARGQQVALPAFKLTHYRFLAMMDDYLDSLLRFQRENHANAWELTLSLMESARDWTREIGDDDPNGVALYLAMVAATALQRVAPVNG